MAGLEELIAKTREFKERPPGSVQTHFGETGFFTRVYDEEKGVLDGIKDYMRAIPAYDPMFFRVAEPAEPKLPAQDLYHLLPFNHRGSLRETPVTSKPRRLASVAARLDGDLPGPIRG